MNYELDYIRDKVMRAVGRNELNTENLNKFNERVSQLTQRKEQLELLQVAVQTAAARTQDKIKSRFETIVQSCLDIVFPNEYTFHFDFVPRRGKTEVDIYLTDSEGKKLDPMNSNGGGIVDVISLALRVGALTMSGRDKVLLLDEPTPHLRGEARERLGEVLNQLSVNLGIQIIMVGDVCGNSVKADKEFTVSKKNGVSSVETFSRAEESYDN